MPETCTLILGNELLGKTNASYGVANVRRFKQAAHTLDAIDDALFQAACELPLHWDPVEKMVGPADVFTGYLLLDVLVGNTDRHHENWGIMEASEATARRHLAPTFDHASSLGCHLLDEERVRRLRAKDAGYSVEAYAEKARSALYLNEIAPRSLKTIEAFQHAMLKWPKAARVWLERLSGLRNEQIDTILDRIPSHRISRESSEFAGRLLLHNRNRLMSLKNSL